MGDEFTAHLAELTTPNTEGFDFFTESKTVGYTVRIFRQYNAVSGLYIYKVYGELPDIDPQTCCDVYNDLEYRKQWDGYVKELTELSKDDEHQIIYWCVAYPFPMSHRDYVFSRKMQFIEPEGGVKQWCIIGQSDTTTDKKEVNKVIRVTDFNQTLALQATALGGTQAFMLYYDDPKGSLPTWLINWAAKTGVPKFMSDLQIACKNYKK